ncbi:MAG: bifunctional (p)ppGpp synthetase/guanosine-3',5'-bis(diphosphate) 3'-pyrophosphohydrolase [Bacteroidales bacterium]|jgi:GTP pyrophosphokinase|nr:bifunctional (p)ppGpp synthetase/guanosine-3',5'-bis(diphosphate) 3'-pyrophosphohydrolase [Bacteroidales bacterium]MCB9027755.1 bifunctional (p)ppGpp synthetase/guanosine-3',5'-bis(diphosphate) 3'-pyrophosphohydrolase [Bacteroidales bacterium]MDD3735708.1 RelA/SpoT family protein [Bacteroidales bacterium]NLD63665.1 bifunctional (p)ppGpp synthetase/guanosine-3',5'-bis(diphosphate) 3'-pyrophosphohydrolase [Bacteroidales bacterium]HNT92277.1 RelA/SpoT family protein [Bacteroidales bacterium]
MVKTKTKIFTQEDINRIESEYRLLTDNLYRCDKPGDRELIEKAFRFANEAHRDMYRNSGEPYVIHPINVARIVNHEIGLGARSVAAALLHDVVEDTGVPLEEITNQFGPKIASLIDGLTKISGTYNKETNSLQAENFRKMLMTLSDDFRVILIKIADRLHNMRTLDSMPEHKRMKIAGETVYLYAPLAHRLGLFAIKTELEDLSFKFRHPRIYEEIARKVKMDEKKNLALINRFSLPIIEELNNNNIIFDISGRFKSIYSIWKKMQSKNVPFEEVYDLLAVRIVFEPGPEMSERAQCWQIYSLITDIYTPKPDRLRDWISRPKPNGYEALHLTVMGPEGRWVEVQIRSQRMDDTAERGFAAHWKYKGDLSQSESELDKWLKHIREMLANPMSDPLTFLDEFKMSLFSSEIMVFTPKGLLVNLPKGASALDFAYEIHTDIGNQAIGAKVNYKLSPLSTTLQSGDQVEIITSTIAKPEKEWLEYAHTAKAKNAIKDALRDQSTDRIQKGMIMLEEKLSELGILPNSDIIKKLLDNYDLLNKDELYSRIGLGLINLDELRKVLKKAPEGSLRKYWQLAIGGVTRKNAETKELPPVPEEIDKNHPYLLRENVDNTRNSYVIASCCQPIPGDEVLGYIDHSNSIIVHKPKCPVAVKLMSSEGNRIIQVRWTIHKLASFLARISINGIDRIGLINEVTTIISKELNVNIRNINVSVYDGIFEGTIDLYVHHTRDLNNLIMQLSNIKGIASVKRIEEFIE